MGKPSWIMRLEGWLSKKITGRIIGAADMSLAVLGGYVVARNGLGIHISDMVPGWLLQPLLKYGLLYVAFGVLIVALVVKVVVCYLDHYANGKTIHVDPYEMAICISTINDELSEHLERRAGQVVPIGGLLGQHKFKRNIVKIVASLANHIQRSCSEISDVRRDVFISVYSFESTAAKPEGLLKYICHYDPIRAVVLSKEMDLSDRKYKDYECVKCISANQSAAYLIDGSEYAIGHSERCKTIKHYLGCRLEICEQTCGFLTIEFHNNVIFNSTDELAHFLENHVYSFKALLEYQFLKRAFLATLRDFSTYWRI
jgi:hypothetical protein